MQVNVFVSQDTKNGLPLRMLVLPFGPDTAIPDHLRDIEWRYLATTEADNPLIGLAADHVRAGLADQGYLLTSPAEQ